MINRSSLIAFFASFLLVASVSYAFTTGTDPARNASTPPTTNSDYLYVNDPSVSGTATGVPNVTPKIINCSNVQALGYDVSTHAIVCQNISGGGGSCPAPCPTELQTITLDAGHVSTIDIAVTGGSIFGADPTEGSLQLGVSPGDPALEAIGSFGTPIVTVLQSGFIRSNTIYYWAMNTGGIPIVVGTFGGIVTEASNQVSVADCSGVVGSAGSGGTTDVIVTITDGVHSCDCDMGPCNGTGAVGGGSNCNNVCVFTAFTPLAFTVSSIGDCVSGPQYAGDLNIGFVYP